MHKRPFTITQLSRRQALRGAVAGGVWLSLGAPVAWAGPVAVSKRELRVVTGPETEASKQMLQALRARYPGLVADAEPATLEARGGAAVYVAIGPAALRKVWGADVRQPVVSVLASSQLLRALQAHDPAGRDRSNISAIHADASPASQLQLVSTLFERRVTVGVLLSDASAYLEKPLRLAALQFGVELLFERAETGADTARSLAALSGAQVLLAVPDASLYTPETLRAVLESTYRRGMPVVGFSAATVTAGTLATAHAGLDDVWAELVELLDPALSGGAMPPWPEPHFPRYWRVVVNQSVARSLGVPVPERVLNLGNPGAGRKVNMLVCRSGQACLMGGVE
jgi:putative tryptophan/tyrosine transport system substrate-binding protein